MSIIPQKPKTKSKLVILTIQRVQIFEKIKNSEHSCEHSRTELFLDIMATAKLSYSYWVFAGLHSTKA